MEPIIYTLFSSSKGNSTFIKYNNTCILVDAGKSTKAISEALCNIGEDIENISDIFITHEHSDHVGALKVLCSKCNASIHMTALTGEQVVNKYSVPEENVVYHTEKYKETVGDIIIHSFVTPHDSIESVGYIFEFKDSDYRFGICTDTGCITTEMVNELSKCCGVIIESNYDKKMMKEGSYPYYLQRRITENTGHQSNDSCARLCVMLAKAGVNKIMLGHISPENNIPELALRCSCNALFKAGFDGFDISVANQYKPTRF